MSKSYRVVKCWREMTDYITGEVTKSDLKYEIQYKNLWTTIWGLGNPWRKLYDPVYLRCNIFFDPIEATKALHRYLKIRYSSIEYKEETVTEYTEIK